MNETKSPVPPQNTPPEVAYQVMPHSDKPNFAAPPAPSHASSTGGSKAVYIIIAIIVLLILGGLAYYFLGSGTKPAETVDDNTSQSRLPTSFMLSNFAKEVCDDDNTCGENADPDFDGLTNYNEFIAGTTATTADYDSDGLADGDEVNIYGVLPKNKFTDNRSIAAQNDFNDGVSILNGYDPTTPGSKFTETRLASIKSKIAQFSLHSPSTTTLGLNPDGSAKTDTTTRPTE